MRTIIFTQRAKPVSDFDAESLCEDLMQALESNPRATVTVCNVLLWNMLRAKLIDNPIKFDTVWMYENGVVDMDTNMRSNRFWDYPVTELGDVALETLLQPTIMPILQEKDDGR